MAPRAPKKPATDAAPPRPGRRPNGKVDPRVAELEQALAERDATIARLEAQLAGAPSTGLLDTHEELLRVAGERVASLEARLKEARDQTDALTRLLTDVEARALEREEAFNALTEELEDARARIADLSGEAERAALLEEAAADSGLLLIALEREVATLRALLAGTRDVEPV